MGGRENYEGNPSRMDVIDITRKWSFRRKRRKITIGFWNWGGGGPSRAIRLVCLDRLKRFTVPVYILFMICRRMSFLGVIKNLEIIFKCIYCSPNQLWLYRGCNFLMRCVLLKLLRLKWINPQTAIHHRLRSSGYLGQLLTNRVTLFWPWVLSNTLQEAFGYNIQFNLALREAILVNGHI